MLFPSISPVSLNGSFNREASARHLDAMAFGWQHLDNVNALDPVPPAATVVKPASDQARSLAAFLLAAALAALLVAADQLIETWTEDHLLMGWVALWTVAFIGLAFLARPMRQISIRLANAWVEWVKKQRLSMQDEQMWADACLDPRLMADIMSAQSRATRN